MLLAFEFRVKTMAQDLGGVMLRGLGLRFQVDQRKPTPNKQQLVMV